MIQWDHVVVEYPSSGGVFRAVDDVSLTIEKGEIFGVAGASGAGKSTLLRTINGLEKPTGGRVLVDGRDVANMDGREKRALRNGIGMIFQLFNLAGSKTAYENIAFALRAGGKNSKEIPEKVRGLLRLVGLSDKEKSYPAQLSGGQKQRVAIARALANDAKILLCDEATSALDPETTESILSLLRDINRTLGVTVVLITHEMEVIKRICHRVAVMNQGRVVELADAYDLFANPRHEFTRQFLSHQNKFDLPEAVLKHAKGTILQLDYAGEAAYEPVLYEISRIYGVPLNILSGRIEYIHDRALGTLFVSLDASPGKTDEALTYLKSHTRRVEVIRDAR